ncbi:MAG: DUF3253 domain-containing protein [Hyphomonadaceae bacterium]|nr:MAG: hypothetical protein FD160_1263 [Caulobacteraceae bacterium]MBT9445549.1 DUF3253 domain-containing protein [Hyphomonadaceae bacterium]
MSVDDAILALAAERGVASSISPEDAARAVDSENWRKRMGEVRDAAVRLAKAGRIVILRKGKPVDPENFKGVIRLRIVDGEV